MAKSSIMANVMNPAIILFSRETISTGSCLRRQLLYEFAITLALCIGATDSGLR
jgi:hypothetical protein